MIAAIVLAAGRGTRFGGGKMLAEISARPMLQYVLDLAAQAELDPVVVVLGEDADAIQTALSWRNEIRIRNEDPGRGISSSVAAGLDALGGDVDGALVLLGDQPFLTLENVRVITGASRDDESPIVVPRYADGRPGNPVLLGRAAWPMAQELTGDQGMSQLFAARPDLVRYIDVPGTNPDIDTESALAAFSRGAG